MHDMHFLRLTEGVYGVFCWRDSNKNCTDEGFLPIQMSNIFFVLHFAFTWGSFVKSDALWV